LYHNSITNRRARSQNKTAGQQQKKMKEKQVIGFANIYYTLWNVREEVINYTAPSGTTFPSHVIYYYNYIKNISTDLDMVKSLYPNVEIDIELRGTSSFTVEKREIDLTPEILKFGKYRGCDVREICKTDLDYIIFCIEKYGTNNKALEIASETTEYIEYIDSKKRALREKVAAFKPLQSGKHKLTLPRNPNSEGEVSLFMGDGQTLVLKFQGVKRCIYSGIEYYLPIFKNGKCKRVRGIELEYELEIETTDIDEGNGICYQTANVIN